MSYHYSYLIPMAGLVALNGCSMSSKKKNKESRRYNIVYIMTDDHAYQTLSCYDQRFASTPNLDRLAAEGVKFTNSFVCNSLSGPSRAVLLTGKHSHKNGYTDNTSGTIFDGSQQTVQQLLQRGGYQTAMIGKWHLGGTPTCFDYWKILPGQGDYYNPDFITPEGKVRQEGYVTDIITDLSIDWLSHKRDTTKPFCLFVHHKAIHRNWMSDTADLALFEDRTFEMPANFWDDYQGRIAAGKQEMSIDKDMTLIYDLKMLDPAIEDHYRTLYIRENGTQGTYGRMNEKQRAAWDKHYGPIIENFKKAKLTGKALAEWKYQRYMRDYLKTVKSLDDNVGRLMDELKKEGLLENTVVIYASDQGFYMGEHGWFDKRFMYEESMRTPLLMRLPDDFGKRRDISQLVQNIDYAPTFLELAGLPVPPDMQGVSLLPLLQGENPADWRSALYYHYYEYPAEHAVRRHYGVRTERYKLIHFYYDIDAWELYALQKDPGEMHNVYGESGTEEIVKELRAELEKLQIQYDDPIREKN